MAKNKAVVLSHVKYEHHGRAVWVKAELQGKHRSHCLCYECDRFLPENVCPIAKELFELNKQHGITTPVWECPNFYGTPEKPKEKK